MDKNRSKDKCMNVNLAATTKKDSFDFISYYILVMVFLGGFVVGSVGLPWGW